MNKTLFVGHNETIKADDIEINSHDYKTTNWVGIQVQINYILQACKHETNSELNYEDLKIECHN